MQVKSTVLIASASGRAQTEQNGNGTEIHRWCASGRTANGRAHVPFRRNGTERKRQCFYASYYTGAYIVSCENVTMGYSS